MHAATTEDRGGRLRVRAPGYLQRDQPRAARVLLWPAPDPEYVRQLVYEAQGSDGPFVHPLERWDAGPQVHCLGPGADRETVAAVAAEVAMVAGIPHAWAGPGEPCNVTWTVDPGRFHPTTPGSYGTAFVARTFEGRAITAAELVFRDVPAFRLGALHEMGHALGLRHSPRRTDVMFRDTPGGPVFSPGERAQLVMMFRREPGNVYPDSAP